MNVAAEKLLADAVALSDSDLAELAARLIESLEREVDEDASAAWSREIQRRLTELDEGAVQTIPWPETRRIIMGQPDDASPRVGARRG